MSPDEARKAMRRGALVRIAYPCGKAVVGILYQDNEERFKISSREQGFVCGHRGRISYPVSSLEMVEFYSNGKKDPRKSPYIHCGWQGGDLCERCPLGEEKPKSFEEMVLTGFQKQFATARQ